MTNAALKILADKDFSFFIPEHAMNFNQGYSLAYMLLPQQPTLYLDTLISTLSKVDPGSQKAIITTLWFAYLCKGDSLMKALMNDKSKHKEVREYTKKIVGYTDLTKDQKDFIKAARKSGLEIIRRESLKRFSDEAIEELDMTTRIMRKEQGCRNE